MIRLLTDEDFNGGIIDEIRRTAPHADLVTAAEVEL